MKIRNLLALVALCVTMLPFGAAHAKKYSIEYLPGNEVYAFCDKEPVPGVGIGPGVNTGAVCIEVNSKQEVRIDGVVDDLSTLVDMNWYWLDKDWKEVGTKSLEEDPEAWLLESGAHHGGACNDTRGQFLKAPRGAKYFYVFVHGPVNSVLATCPDGAFSSHGFVNFTVRAKR